MATALTHTYHDTGRLVETCLEIGLGLRVDLDPCDGLDLYGEDLNQTWAAIAPGEAFVVRAVLPYRLETAHA